MITFALSKVRFFLSSWKNWLVIGALPVLGTWLFIRVSAINPTILADEYLYSMNSRKVGPWEPPVSGDFSNYLFNFVYQGTNLCGDAFYSCAKSLNIAFFLGFTFLIFIVASRFLPFWIAFSFFLLASLSPLSIYTSMYLPESMYFFFIGLVLLSVLRALKIFNWKNWLLVGVTLGVTSLVKPHAWLSAIAVFVTLVVVSVGHRKVESKSAIRPILALMLGAVSARLAIGLLIAGPKALGFFGQYFGASQLSQLVPNQSAQEIQEGSSGPVTGIQDTFISQTYNHSLTILAIMGIAVISLIVALVDISRSKQLSYANGFALFSFIWLVSLMLEIVIFTGWVTGLGDDHTLRVLLRYYDFLFVIVPLAGLSAAFNRSKEPTNVLVRWGLSLAVSLAITPAFSGHFASLTIQIADAPTLAGLVVNQDVFNATAMVGFLGVIVFATFPKFFPWTYLFLLPFSMAGTGFQIQEQYIYARGQESEMDSAGKFIHANFSDEEIDRGLILASSRFDATNIAFWADSPRITYELYNPGGTYSSERLPSGTSFVISTGGLTVVGSDLELVSKGETFQIYSVKD